MVSYSYPLDFSRTKNFIERWNQDFLISEMGQSNKFQFVFAEYSPSTIDECLTSNGLIDESVVTNRHNVDATLSWDSENQIVSVKDDVTWNVGNIPKSLKSVFLRNKRNNVVMGYSIFSTPVSVYNNVIIGSNSILWSFT